MMDKKALEGICENLIKYDPNIVEIISLDRQYMHQNLQKT